MINRIRTLVAAFSQNPERVGLSVALLVYGGFAIAALAHGLDSDDAALPFGIVLAFAAVSIVGGSATLVGITLRGKVWSSGVEQFGLILSATSWVVFGITILIRSHSFTAWCVAGIVWLLAVASLAGARALRKGDLHQLAVLRQTNGGA